MSQGVIAVATIVAIIAGPLFTLLLQKWTEARREKRQARQFVFRTLMMYRATPLNPNFVQALNLIDVVFDSKKKTENTVRTDWKKLLDHLNNNAQSVTFVADTKTYIGKLLSEMGACLGYTFDEVYIQRHSYQPAALTWKEEEQQSLRKLMLEVLRGNKRLSVSMFPEDFPPLRLPAQDVLPQNLPRTITDLHDE
jgi:hypothetical protein